MKGGGVASGKNASNTTKMNRTKSETYSALFLTWTKIKQTLTD
jgi:hypothetical protein